MRRARLRGDRAARRRAGRDARQLALESRPRMRWPRRTSPAPCTTDAHERLRAPRRRSRVPDVHRHLALPRRRAARAAWSGSRPRPASTRRASSSASRTRTARSATAVTRSCWACTPSPPTPTDLAELFGGETGDEVDKFARTAWRDVHGVPILDRCRELVRRPCARALRRRRPRRVSAGAGRSRIGGTGRVHLPPRQADRPRSRGVNLTVGRLTARGREVRSRRVGSRARCRFTRGSCGIAPGPVIHMPASA